MSNEVLTKVGNKAEWAAGGAGGVQVVTITGEGGNTGTASHTGAEIREMLKNGPVVATIIQPGFMAAFTANFLSSVFYPEESMNYVVFSIIQRMPDDIYGQGYYFIDGESTAVTIKSYRMNMS